MVQCPCSGVIGSCESDDYRPWKAAWYVAVASAYYIIIVAMNLYRTVWAHKKHMGSSYFPFNASTISILSVAATVPSDVTNSDPGVFDELLPLSGIFLICVTMNLCLPSLGVMDDHEVIGNLVGLFPVVNEQFWKVNGPKGAKGSSSSLTTEQRLFSCVMVFLFFILASHSLTVLTTRRTLNFQYGVKDSRLHELPDASGDPLRGIFRKYWLLAVTSNPDHALRSSGVPLVSAVLTWGVLGTTFACRFARFALACSWSCNLRFGYQKFGFVLLLIHVTGITLGTFAFLCKGLVHNPMVSAFARRHSSLLRVVADYLFFKDWKLQILNDWMGTPPPFELLGNEKIARKVYYLIRNLFLISSAMVQVVVILVSTTVLAIFAVAWTPALSAFRGAGDQQFTGQKADKGAATEEDLEGYDLRLQECKGVERMWLDYPDRWLEKAGSSGKNKHLYHLVSESSFKTAAAFDLYRSEVKDIIPGEQPPRSWALTLATLAKLINVNFRKQSLSRSIELAKMMSAVDEVIGLARLVDLNLAPRGTSERMLAAAELVWDDIADIHAKWFHGKDLSAVQPSVIAVVTTGDDEQEEEDHDDTTVQQRTEEPKSCILSEDSYADPPTAIPSDHPGCHFDISTMATGGVRCIAITCTCHHCPRSRCNCAQHPEAKCVPDIEGSDQVKRENSPRGDSKPTPPLTIIRKVEDIAKEQAKKILRESPLKLTPKLLAANSLYKIAGSINQSKGLKVKSIDKGSKKEIGDDPLRAFQLLLADHMIACLTKLPAALVAHCSNAKFGERERRVHEAIVALGKARHVFDFLEDKDDEVAKGAAKQYVDLWYSKQEQARQYSWEFANM